LLLDYVRFAQRRLAGGGFQFGLRGSRGMDFRAALALWRREGR